MSFRVFLDILERWCPHVRKSKKKTNCGDHCHLWHTQIVPGLSDFEKDVRTALVEKLPDLLDDFDTDKIVIAAKFDDLPGYAKLLLQYLSSYYDSYPAVVPLWSRSLRVSSTKKRPSSGRGPWEIKVLEAYAWYRRLLCVCCG